MPGDLDAAIRERLDWDRQQAITAPEDRIVDVALYAIAIRAVLGLHKPEQVGTLTPWHKRCVECSMRDVTLIEWPCPTVQAIAKALGVTERTDQ